MRLGQEAAQRLVQMGLYEIGPGLTEGELTRIERDYDFEFADDHRAFLSAGLPLNIPTAQGETMRAPWPDWRDGEPGDLHKQLDRPVSGVLFDVENNGVWLDSWGARPADTTQAVSIARGHLAQAPKMIPIYAHRYLPAGRGTYGNPVLSIYQTDIIFYGTDLADYINSDSPWQDGP